MKNKIELYSLPDASGDDGATHISVGGGQEQQGFGGLHKLLP